MSDPEEANTDAPESPNPRRSAPGSAPAPVNSADLLTRLAGDGAPPYQRLRAFGNERGDGDADARAGERRSAIQLLLRPDDPFVPTRDVGHWYVTIARFTQPVPPAVYNQFVETQLAMLPFHILYGKTKFATVTTLWIYGVETVEQAHTLCDALRAQFGSAIRLVTGERFDTQLSIIYNFRGTCQHANAVFARMGADWFPKFYAWLNAEVAWCVAHPNEWRVTLELVDAFVTKHTEGLDEKISRLYRDSVIEAVVHAGVLDPHAKPWIGHVRTMSDSIIYIDRAGVFFIGDEPVIIKAIKDKYTAVEPVRYHAIAVDEQEADAQLDQLRRRVLDTPPPRTRAAAPRHVVIPLAESLRAAPPGVPLEIVGSDGKIVKREHYGYPSGPTPSPRTRRTSCGAWTRQRRPRSTS
jgi:hypothetical protein